jgi:hypothetical protein
MISLIPFRHIVIKTSLSRESAASILSASLKIPRRKPSLLRWFQGNPKRYRGAVSGDGFKIARDYPAWSDSSPIAVAYGRYSQQRQGTEIDVRIMPHPVAGVVGVMICLVFVFHCVSKVVEWLRTGSPDKELFYVGMLMTIIYAFAAWVFNLEANAASDFVEDTYGKYRS